MHTNNSKVTTALFVIGFILLVGAGFWVVKGKRTGDVAYLQNGQALPQGYTPPTTPPPAPGTSETNALPSSSQTEKQPAQSAPASPAPEASALASPAVAPGQTSASDQTPSDHSTAPSSVSTISLGQDFTAAVGQTFTIANTTDTFTLTGFFDHPCPSGTQCVWSGLDVFYTIDSGGQSYVKDQPLETPDGMPYAVTIISSDYQTTATLSLSLR